MLLTMGIPSLALPAAPRAWLPRAMGWCLEMMESACIHGMAPEAQGLRAKEREQ